jgi:hypothetical protein
LILEGALQVHARGGEGLGVMMFPDGLFKYIDHLTRHIKGLAETPRA